MTGKRLLLAEEHLLHADTLAAHIEAALDGARVKVVTNLRDVLETIALYAFDLVLLDLALPGMHGLAGIRVVQERCPDIRVAVLSGSGSGQEVMDALRAGAVGFIPKSLRRDAVTNALLLMFSGALYVPGDVLLSSAGAVNPSRERPTALPPLTLRERDVLKLLMAGRSNKEIARDLGLGVGTVAIHLNRAYRKLGVARRTQAVQAVLMAGWVL